LGILRPDSFISVLRVFNFFDLKNKGIDNLYFDYKIRNEIQETEIGSFLRFPSLILFTSPSLGDYNGFIEGRIELHKRLHKYELVFDICDRYLQRKLFDPSFSIILDSDLNDLTPEKDNEAIILRKIAIKKTNEMILNLIAKIGFHFFNIPYLREHLSDLVYRSYIPEHSKILKQIRELFFVHIEKNRNIVTDKQYWFYYCLVAKFSRKVIEYYPYKINYILTDNGFEFSYKALTQRKRTKKIHPFDKICINNKIQHRTIKFRHPWTNGMVERFNRTIREKVLDRQMFSSIFEMEGKLIEFVNKYNLEKRLKSLNYKTPALNLKENNNIILQPIVN